MHFAIRIASLAAAALCTCAGAVILSPNGRGQALIFPYYTTQAAADGAFNTLISITNTSKTVKALKVVLREGRAGKWVAEWNVYLAAADMWTAGLVPDAVGMKLFTADISCTDLPPTVGGGVPINANMLTFTSDDGLGTNVERVREGYIEVFEMAVLSGLAQTYAGSAPRQCDLLRGLAPMPVSTPTGGISGSATLINVSAARAFSYDAIALDELASQPYFAKAIDEGVGFNAGAIDPVSVITFGGNTYRSRWGKSVDAVTAVLMTREIEGEYVLDAGTQSKTDWVLAFPTRRHYVSRTTVSPPFGHPLTPQPSAANCEWLYPYPQGRDDTEIRPAPPFEPPPPSSYGCWSATVVSFRQSSTSPVSVSDVFASLNTGGVISGGGNEHGWARLDLPIGVIISSDTTVFNHATATLNTTTSFTLTGLPVTGFAATTYANGFLNCGGATCKGNYGATFRLRPRVNESLK